MLRRLSVSALLFEILLAPFAMARTSPGTSTVPNHAEII